ncbi:hypothetical protein [Streptomyces sp. CC228A]|uniref:hypothetical protein n=1 Tax=Streptomyces sp. CC228A TaxID=2898186 RepID=UPI001F4202B2|nr:hypothetical protein [Streptomyces sp. CC228A]
MNLQFRAPVRARPGPVASVRDVEEPGHALDLWRRHVRERLPGHVEEPPGLLPLRQGAGVLLRRQDRGREPM